MTAPNKTKAAAEMTGQTVLVRVALLVLCERERKDKWYGACQVCGKEPCKAYAGLCNACAKTLKQVTGDAL